MNVSLSPFLCHVIKETELRKGIYKILKLWKSLNQSFRWPDYKISKLIVRYVETSLCLCILCSKHYCFTINAFIICRYNRSSVTAVMTSIKAGCSIVRDLLSLFPSLSPPVSLERTRESNMGCSIGQVRPRMIWLRKARILQHPSS